MYVVAVRLHPHFIEFEADHFNGYLKEEQAQEALAIRERAGQTDQPGRMYYTKLVKTFVQVGRQPTGYYQRPVGHELEIIPLSNPCRWQEGEQVTVRVLYKGRPAANMRVSSGHKGLPHDTFAETVFTDSAGMARLMLTRPGLWFLRAHLIRPVSRTNERAAHKPQADKPQADWESFWSSLTFRVHDQLGE